MTDDTRDEQDALDARRYRFLRDHYLICIAHPAGRDGYGITMDEIIPGDDADQAIDEAMRPRDDDF